MPRLEAVHIDHGLHHDSNNWAQHCQTVCDGLSVPLHVLSADLSGLTQNIEAEARRARYRLIATLLNDLQVQGRENLYSCVFVGQHQQDQVETFLYRLMRGAGLKGLQGMSELCLLSDVDNTLTLKHSNKVFLTRPLLTISQKGLQDYAEHHELRWVEDPSNSAEQFDRNYLRHKVLPLLQQRWPAFQQRLSKNIQFLQRSQAMLDELAQIDIKQSLEAETLQAQAQAQHSHASSAQIKLFHINEPAFYWPNFLTLPEGRSRFINALQYWLAQQGQILGARFQLSEAQLENLVAVIFDHSKASKKVNEQLNKAFKKDHNKEHEKGYALLSHRNGLYIVAERRRESIEDSSNADLTDTNWGQGVLTWQGCRYQGSHAGFTFLVKARPESATVLIKGKSRKVKKLLQESQVPIWQRDKLPYLFSEGQLVAIGHIVLSDQLIQQGYSISLCD